MKKWLLLILIISISFFILQKNEKSYRLELVFEDNFKGEILDKKKWNTDLKVFGRIDDTYLNKTYQNIFLKEDVLVKDSLLLRSKYIGNGLYSSGLVSSHEKFVFRYGYIEICAKFPKGKGVWPAFWLMPQNQTWPPEIDIAEYYGGKKTMHTGLCYGDFPEVLWDSDGYFNNEIEESFSTYGLWWTSKELIWLQNGIPVKITKSKNIPNIPMYIILSNGVSNDFGPSFLPDEKTIFPNFLEVSYIRVYKMIYEK